MKCTALPPVGDCSAQTGSRRRPHLALSLGLASTILVACALGPPVQAQEAPGIAWRDARTGIEFVWIPAGDFRMGCVDNGGNCASDELPRHRVTITKGFWLARTEVTVQQFRQFVEETGYKTQAEAGAGAFVWNEGRWEVRPDASWRTPFFGQTEDHPVVCVSWGDCEAYCRWAGYRLPTEAEWEYAARGGLDGRGYPWGRSSNPVEGGRNLANLADESGKRKHPRWTVVVGYDDGYPETAPVGSFAPNSWGLFDVLGNVWEWCADGKRVYDEREVVDPLGPVRGRRRAVRGGSWDSSPALLTLSKRGANALAGAAFNLGFRCARDEPRR